MWPGVLHRFKCTFFVFSVWGVPPNFSCPLYFESKKVDESIFAALSAELEIVGIYASRLRIVADVEKTTHPQTVPMSPPGTPAVLPATSPGEL